MSDLYYDKPPSSLDGSTIPSGTETVSTDGYASPGKGAATYVYDATVTFAVASANPRWAFRALDERGFRLSEDQHITIEMFGAVGDGVTNDYPAWLAYKAYCDALKSSLDGSAYDKAVPELHFSRRAYLLDPGTADPAMDLTDGAYRIVCNPRTTIYIAAGRTGLVANSWDTTGVSGTTTNTPKGSLGSIIENMNLISLGGTVGAEQHGFVCRAPVTLINCSATDFGGDGFQWSADTAAGNGNANRTRMIDCSALNCGRDGLNIGPTLSTNADVNAGYTKGFNAIACGRYGIRENSFLGNRHTGFHIASCGQHNAHPSWAADQPPSRCTHGGFVYRVIPGEAAGAANNAPTGARTDNSWWHYCADGSGTNADQPAWSNNTAFREGGAILQANLAAPCFFDGYMEVDENIVGSMNAGWGEQRMIAMGQNQSWHRGTHLVSFSYSGTDALTGRFAHRSSTAANQEIHTVLGSYSGDGHLSLYHQDYAPAAFHFQWKDQNLRELAFAYGGLDSSDYWPFYITGSGTTNPIGANRIGFPAGFGLGHGSDARRVTNGTAMPGMGTWQQGDFVLNTSPSVSGGKILLGWMRLTTGSGHVPNTDWSECYVTTS